MSILEWKRVSLLKLQNYSERDTFPGISADIISFSNNGSLSAFCDSNGNVRIYNNECRYVSFPVEGGAIKLCALSTENVFVTLQQDVVRNDITLQIFNIQKLGKRGKPLLLSVARLNSLSSATLIGVETYDNKIIIAIGFEKGDILYHYASLSRDISSNFHQVSLGMTSIVDVKFEIKRKNNPITCNMFVISKDGICSFAATENVSNIESTRLVLDAKKNTNTYCCIMHYFRESDEAYLVIGRHDAIYCFTADGRGPCFAIDGMKKSIAWVGNYLIVLQTVENISGLNSMSSLILLVVDVQNKIIVFNKQLADIEYLVHLNELCFVMNKTLNRVLILKERDTPTKIKMLIKKHMFDTALNILGHYYSAEDFRSAAYINFQYGNYLLHKGENNAAVSKFIKTIGVIKPYDIIEKLSDYRYNETLIEYLEALVNSNFSTEEHQKLLISCREHLNLPINLKCLYKSECNKKYIDLSIQTSQGKKREEVLLSNEEVKQKDCPLTEEDIYITFTETTLDYIQKNSIHILEVLKTLIISHKITRLERFVSLLASLDKVCLDFLETAIVHHEEAYTYHKLYHFLIMLYLQLWRNNEISDVEILKFIDKYKIHSIPGHIIVLCSLYKFDSGLKYLNSGHESEFDYVETNIHKITQALIRSRLYKSDNFDGILLNYLKEKSQYFLQITQSILDKGNLTVSHIKNLFSEMSMQKRELRKELLKMTNLLKLQIGTMNAFMVSFTCKPIEFRKNSCDICRQQLHIPCVYYLCQHCFHKECISGYTSDNCIMCASKNESSSLNQMQISTTANFSATIITLISTFLAKGKFNPSLHFSYGKNPHRLLASSSSQGRSNPVISMSEPMHTNPVPGVVRGEYRPSNPFDEDVNNYNNNLNPFN